MNSDLSTLKKYFENFDGNILDRASKDDIIRWLTFLESAPDSTTLLKYYAPFHAIMGFYVAQISGRLKTLENTRDRLEAAIRRKVEERSSKRATEGQVQSACASDQSFNDVIVKINVLETLKMFLRFIKETLSETTLQSFASNERLEMKADLNG